MRTAILGGTFDPVHLGHLLIADEVCATLGYERIVFVPAWGSPHKDSAPRTSGRTRMAMLELATAERSDFEVESFEVDRQGVSYTIETLRYLRDSGRVAGIPGLIIGQDLVGRFETWHQVDEIVAGCEIIVAGRPVDETSVLDRPHRAVSNPLFDVSSSSIRERIARSLPYRYLVHPEVYRYIEREQLYRSGR